MLTDARVTSSEPLFCNNQTVVLMLVLIYCYIIFG